ncbi:MAG: hypothetical protein GC129_02905 [Proteobacteria bacterium]|nr:hypothetical protein [Pseudomonadota bacterium]
MTITFNTNLSALTSQRYIGIASNNASGSLAKLSSGSRIPQAKDDAAGLAIGSKLKAEVAGLTQASNNASQAVSLLQIADGALSTIGDMLVRMKTLATQASSGQLADAERGLLNQEFTNLRSEVDRIANTANFNGTNLLSGSTVVSSNTNHLSSVGTSVAVDGSTIGNAANSQISQGVQSVNFNSTVDTPAVKLEYDAAHNLMTMTDLSTGNTSSATVSSTAIATGSTETLSFAGLGATVVLNSNFDKSASSSVTNGVREATYTAANGGGGGLTTTAGLSSISAFRLKPNGTGGVSAGNFNGVAFTLNSTASGDGALSTITGTVVGDDGANHVFSVKKADGSTGGTVDLSTTGAKTVTLVDSSGNEFDLSFTVGTAFANNQTSTITGTLSGINTSRTDVAATSLNFVNPTVGVSTGAVDGVSIQNVDFSGLNPPLLSAGFAAPITFSTAGGKITASGVTINGRAFTNTTGAVDFTTTTGDRTFTYDDGQGNSFDLVFDIGTTALAATSTLSNLASPTLTSTPAVQNNSIHLLAVNKTAASTFDFGDLDRAKVTFNAGTANSSGATLTLGDGSTFTASAINLATTGVKTITLAGQGPNAGASLTFSFNLTGALSSGDSLSVDIGEIGQVVGVNSTTGGSTSFSFKVGTGATTNDSITFALNSATTSSLGISSSTVDTAANADNAIAALNTAISGVSSRRADVGANQSRLGFASASISVAIENTTAATSAILDVDVSSEITNFTSQQVLLQAGISLLAQANQQPALLLRLLQ